MPKGNVTLRHTLSACRSAGVTRNPCKSDTSAARRCFEGVTWRPCLHTRRSRIHAT
jgi:hypothetical protein